MTRKSYHEIIMIINPGDIMTRLKYLQSRSKYAIPAMRIKPIVKMGAGMLPMRDR